MIHLVQLQKGIKNPSYVDCELRGLEYLRTATLYDPLNAANYTLTWDGTQYSATINKTKHIFALGETKDAHSKYITFSDSHFRVTSHRTSRP